MTSSLQDIISDLYNTIQKYGHVYEILFDTNKKRKKSQILAITEIVWSGGLNEFLE